MNHDTDLWVFGYGSLMWNPGFPFLERTPARVHGFHRAFCMTSEKYRGTPDRPGLVLGLDRGGSCLGIAYRVAAADREATVAYLHEREMFQYVYLPKTVCARLGDGRRVSAHTYVADRHHPRYAGGLPRDRIVRMIAQGRGQRGRCSEYLENTVRHLDELGIEDGPMHALLDEVRAYRN